MGWSGRKVKPSNRKLIWSNSDNKWLNEEDREELARLEKEKQDRARDSESVVDIGIREGFEEYIRELEKDDEPEAEDKAKREKVFGE